VVFPGKLDGNYAEQLQLIFPIQHASTHTGLLLLSDAVSMGYI
jgi:hypothetical protein